MPAKSRKKPGWVGVFFEAPEALVEQLRQLAVANGRDFRDELVHAVARHLAAPPTVRIIVDEPALAPVKVERPAVVPKRRGRPLKAGQPAAVKKPGRKPKGKGERT
jgi:hypothetical protein